MSAAVFPVVNGVATLIEASKLRRSRGCVGLREVPLCWARAGNVLEAAEGRLSEDNGRWSVASHGHGYRPTCGGVPCWETVRRWPTGVAMAEAAEAGAVGEPRTEMTVSYHRWSRRVAVC